MFQTPGPNRWLLPGVLGAVIVIAALAGMSLLRPDGKAAQQRGDARDPYETCPRLSEDALVELFSKQRARFDRLIELQDLLAHRRDSLARLELRPGPDSLLDRIRRERAMIASGLGVVRGSWSGHTIWAEYACGDGSFYERREFWKCSGGCRFVPAARLDRIRARPGRDRSIKHCRSLGGTWYLCRNAWHVAHTYDG